MKKLTFILAAVACLFLTSCTVEYSCTYIIGHYVESVQTSGDPQSEGYKLYNEFTAEMIAYDKAHQSEWEWTVYVKGDDYKNSDNEALAKYDVVVADIEAIHNKYVEKFKNCSDPTFEMSEHYYVELKRISNVSATIGRKDFTLAYKK